jgi:predicted nucleotidyltransferase
MRLRADIDLLVEFAEDTGDQFEAYLGLKEELEHALARPGG